MINAPHCDNLSGSGLTINRPLYDYIIDELVKILTFADNVDDHT